MTKQKRMAGLSLSDFAGDKASKKQAKPKTTDEPTTTMNIKIPRSLHQWLSDTAQQIRDNNPEPVPASERVFPQHLIQVAIALLEKTEVDWNQVQSVDDVRNQLDL